MPRSRGVQCSWIEAQRMANEVLPALENGKGKRYAALRCVEPNTVSRWKRSAEVLAVIKDRNMHVHAFAHFQPSHATEIGRAFKSLAPWSEETKDAIEDCIDTCEADELTTTQIRKVAKAKAWALRGDKRKRKTKAAKGTYEVLLCDPPWRYDFAETTNREIENQYPTMSVEELIAQPIPAAKKAVLFLWATAPKLPEALEVMAGWEFTYKTCAVWDKEKIGMGYWFRGQHELLLVGTRKDYSPPDSSARKSSMIRASRTKHSEKPRKVHKLIESYYPDLTENERVELFARTKVPGWSTWGNEI